MSAINSISSSPLNQFGPSLTTSETVTSSLPVCEAPVEKKRNESPCLTDQEIKLRLIAMGVLPTPEEAKKQYWALGDEWWKQIIDGVFHRFGPMVFDENLHHGYGAEPGYLKGVAAASLYFTKRFDAKLNFELYRDIHHEACSHFRGKENATECDATRIDSVRTGTGSMEFGYEAFQFYLGDLFLKAFDAPTQALQMEKFKQRLTVEIKEVEKYLGVTLHNYEISQLYGDLTFKLSYTLKDEELKKTADKIFSIFNWNLSDLRRQIYEKRSTADLPSLRKEYQTSATLLIAQLYALLEWLHPWIDGQGRTDLILLDGVLCREGLHPCILEAPYYSTFRNIEEWHNYLLAGLKSYQKLAAEREKA